ncbi:MAG: hypothetical protein IKJ26_01710 [Clostridia bacterium]|nr:hypothetical protein [Clostridia bacterium]
MSSGFRKFVEWATDSRYVPLGSLCSLCGKKLGFFHTGFWSTNACKLADGELCEKCAENVDRLIATMPEWLKADMLQQSSWIQYKAHNWHTLTVKTAAEIITSKEQAVQEMLASFGNDKNCLFRIVEVVQIEPTALQVGVARAKRLRSKVAVFGMVERGSFSRHNVVQLEQQEASVGTTILEAYAWDCEENTLEVNLRADMGKHRLVEGKLGWLVLDYEGDVDEDAFVVR